MRPSMCAVVVIVSAACSSDPAPPRPVEYGGARSTILEVPDDFDAGKDYPLLLMLHGYGATGFVQQSLFQTAGLVDANEALVLAPDGTLDSMGRQFWNADPACCDFDRTGIDDVGYLQGLVLAVIADYPVDAKRVFIVGHSNGGYMAYRMACEHAETFAAIGVLAGVTASDPASCTPTQPVNVLHMHGTADDTVPFTTAATSISQWAAKDGCTGATVAGTTLDLEASIAGAETTTSTVAGCPPGTTIEEWAITGAGHVPMFQPTFGRTVAGWLTTHARP